MQIKYLSNVSEKEIEEKEFNIMVPLCIGNKFFLNGKDPTKMVLDYIKWALKNTKEKVVILIADSIQISNWSVRSTSISYDQKVRALRRLGRRIERNILKLVYENFTREQVANIEVIRWEDYYESDPLAGKTTKIVYDEFEKNEEFRDAIVKAIEDSITDRKFTKEQYLTLSKYVLDEFALAYHGITYEGIYYGFFIYPVTDKIFKLIENIKKDSNLFSKLSHRLPSQKCGVALVNTGDIENYYHL